MPKPPVAVSVAIPCFRNEASLQHTLSRVLECDPPPQEILLHYDGAWEPAEDLTLNCPVPIRVFRSSQNLGPGGGRDLTFKAAACEIVCSFDDDSWPLDPDFFQQALAVMNTFPKAAVMSPAVYLREKPVLPRMLEVNEGVSFEGSASITRRSHYLQLPGYVPVPNAYGVEEVDISLQAHAAGFQILHCPWLRAWHDRPYADYQHGLVPWVKNEVLMAYLRYPRWLQPWGWLRAVRHVVNHYSPERLGSFLRALASTPALCQRYSSYRRRYSIREVWRHHFSLPKRWTLHPEEEGRITVSPASVSRRALYVQYTNPAAYPPLEHSSQILASRGWQVAFAGLTGRGSTVMAFPPFPRIKVHSMKWCAPGLKQKLHYLGFVIWTALLAMRNKPEWLYCSDPLSASAGLLARQLSGARLVYHEHDSPAPVTRTDKWFARFAWRQRHRIACRADVVVVPNQVRLDAFLAENPSRGRAFCIWNCPSKADLQDTPVAKKDAHSLRVLYHGSIVPERFPVLILEALAASQRPVTLRLIGYEVPGQIGYTDRLKAEAERLGVAHRFEYLGTIPQRSDLMACARDCDVGLSLLRYQSNDINMRHMTGASNKPFDYMSQGLALIVPSEPEWEKLFVDNGCAKSCDPASREELASLLQWMADHREQVTAMGARGQRLVAEKWNYEMQFQPLLELMESLPQKT